MAAHGFDDGKNIADFSTIMSRISNLENRINNFYPVGSIYMSAKNINPSTFLGGTWVAWGQGRVPVGMGGSYTVAEGTGGSENETMNFSGSVGDTALTQAQMPVHKHKVEYYSSTDPEYVHHEVCGDWIDGGSEATHYVMISTSDMIEADGKLHIKSGIEASGGLVTENKGSGQAHTHSLSINNKTVSHMQPYITCYMWKRTA